MKVKFLNTDCYTGQQNMALDEKMLNDAILGEFDFMLARFYKWFPKCVSLGRNQKIDVNGIDVVRRKTGGRALLHDNELTYAIVGRIKEGEKVIDTYKRVSNCLILGFKKLGIKLEYGIERGGNEQYCMAISSGADISYKGRKLIGSAQYRTNGYFLQHGSIVYDFDYDLIENLFKAKVDRAKLVGLNEIKKVSDNELVEALKHGFEHGFNL